MNDIKMYKFSIEFPNNRRSNLTYLHILYFVNKNCRLLFKFQEFLEVLIDLKSILF